MGNEKLQDYVRKYLDVNGLQVKFYADCIGCNRQRASRWLSGAYGFHISPNMKRKTHDFINGKYHKTICDILEEEK